MAFLPSSTPTLTTTALSSLATSLSTALLSSPTYPAQATGAATVTGNMSGTINLTQVNEDAPPGYEATVVFMPSSVRDEPDLYPTSVFT
ncbi:hypothetical protein BT69DRAFT_1288605 [Atractiella rhizophila]|nr:hypothetical protein BT69DRAFT_1288605 [Atractiella rhizophila]